MSWFYKEVNRRRGHFQVATPSCVRNLIIATVATSLLSPVISFILFYFFRTAGFIHWLPLSHTGIQKGWVWQFVSYLFVQSPQFGISLSLLFSLFFLMLILWFAGTEIASHFGCLATLCLYFGSGIVSGLFVGLFLYLFSSPTILAGCSPAVYSLLVVWAMLLPDLEFRVFFMLRFRAKWLVAALLTVVLLVDLSYGEWVFFLNDLIGMICGFVVGSLIWKLPNPYPFEFPFKKKHDDAFLFEDDEAFMDRMLDKISRKGKRSLTSKERQRMRTISEKRKFKSR